VVILISLVTVGTGKFPCCKRDYGNRVCFGSASGHVLTENYSAIAFRVFALDPTVSLYGHVGHLPARWLAAQPEMPTSHLYDAAS
jgi:hypothetical protein